MKHAWPPIGIDQEDLLKIRQFLKEGKYYDITINETALDKAFAKTLEQMGKNVKVGSKIKISEDCLAQGDKIIKVVFDEKLKKTIHKIFKKNKKLDETAMQEIITRIVTAKNNIQIIIKTDKKQCQEMRNAVLEEFKSN
jgi:hypothetical protein